MIRSMSFADRKVRSIPAVVLVTLATAAAPIPAQSGAVGLSPVRAELFRHTGNDEFPAAAGDLAGWAFAVGDFDGDGIDDLATGVPGADGPVNDPASDAGVVLVRFGRPRLGLPEEPSDRMFESTPLAHRGFALAACDFDGDGLDDLAVGAPDENVGGDPSAGAVHVTSGLGATQRITQDSFNLQEGAEPGDLFGFALACGDVDDDGFADLVVSAPAETVAGQLNAGQAHWVAGSASGLDLARVRHFSQQSILIPSEPEVADFFGYSLALGDWNGDGRADLALGAVGEDSSAGAVHVLLGSSDGPAELGSLLLTEDTLGGLSEGNDLFGFALAGADFDGDGFDDLAIGAPLETLALPGRQDVAEGGIVWTLAGDVDGFDLARTEAWTEERIHGPGSSEEGDHFGWALAAGNHDGDGFDDLAIGHEGEDGSAGALTVLVGTPAGPSSERHRRFALALEGVPGNGDLGADARLGRSLAAGDFDGDGFADLVIGAPFHDHSSGMSAVGAELVLYGALLSDGFETADPFLAWSEVNP